MGIIIMGYQPGIVVAVAILKLEFPVFFQLFLRPYDGSGCHEHISK
jgi:predicted RNase H-like nuclease (RuvC/YqgF family)